MSDETTEEFFKKADEERERREVCAKNRHPCCDIARATGDQNRDLRAENARLREALEEALQWAECDKAWFEDSDVHLKWLDLARAALGQTSGRSGDDAQACGPSAPLDPSRRKVSDEINSWARNNLGGGGGKEQDVSTRKNGETPVLGESVLTPAPANPAAQDESDGPCRYCGRTREVCLAYIDSGGNCCERCEIGGWVALHKRIPKPAPSRSEGKCDRCGGSGKMEIAEDERGEGARATCDLCHGTGQREG